MTLREALTASIALPDDPAVLGMYEALKAVQEAGMFLGTRTYRKVCEALERVERPAPLTGLGA